MNCIIDNFDFYNMEAMKYYSVPSTWSAEKKKANAINKIFSDQWWGSQKRDGIFCMTGRNLDGEIFLRPRSKNTKGEFVNKVDWVPQIHSFLNDIDPGTVFLGELYLPRDEQAKTTTSIMNCLLPKSLKRQEKEEDKLILYIFDVLAENGVSYINTPAEDRFDMLNSFSRAYPEHYVEWARYYHGKKLWDLLQNLLADGYEGVVITNGKASYQPGKRSNAVSLKIKKELQDTIDCVVIGANPPTKQYTGKEPENWEYWYDEGVNEKITATAYAEKHGQSVYKSYFDGAPVIPVTKNWFNGWAGSLKLGLFDSGKLVHVGDLSGVTDQIKERWQEMVGQVAEISCMEITQNQQGGWGFRHPKLLGWRADKPAEQCTVDQIK